MVNGNACMSPARDLERPANPVLRAAAYWAAVLTWMAVISLLSTDPFSAANTNRYLDPLLRFLLPGISTAQLLVAHTIVRKTAHFTEFFILGSLAYWACRRGRAPRWRSAWMLQALGLGVLYAFIDEAHQVLVPTRTSSVIDSGIDSLGAATSQAFIYLRHLVFTRLAPRIT